MKTDISQKLQIGFTSSVELIRASLEPYLPWIEQTMGVVFYQTVTLAVVSNPGDIVAERLLKGLPLTSSLAARKCSWDRYIEDWSLPRASAPASPAPSIGSASPTPPPPPFGIWTGRNVLLP